MDPAVSVILINYNNQDYISDAILSVKNQTFQNWECIIIDDGSTDNSRKIITDAIGKDPRFRTIFQDNHGASNARNVGIDTARGRYIMFLDSDDFYTPVAMEALYNSAILNNADVVGGLSVNVPEDFKLNKQNVFGFLNQDRTSFISSENIFQDYVSIHTKLGEPYKWLWIWRQMFRRELLSDKRFIEDMFPGEDICFMLDVVAGIKKFTMIDTLVIYHRVSATSATNNGPTTATVSYFPEVLRYIQENKNRYPQIILNWFLPGFANHIFKDLFSEAMRHNKHIRLIADSVREVYNYPTFLKKKLRWYQRLTLWMLLKAYPK